MKFENVDPFAYVFPAGMYYVGDLCYVVKPANSHDGDLWNEYCNETNRFYEESLEKGKEIRTVVTDNGHTTPIAAAYTLYGDGEYQCSVTGKTFGVDSGTIGVIAYDNPFVSTEKFRENMDNVFTFDEPFVFEGRANGYFRIGGVKSHKTLISIETGDDGSEDDEE